MSEERAVAATGIEGIRMGEVGRFLVPFDADDIVAWFLENLFLGHNLRERLAGTAASELGPAWLARTAFDRCWTLEPPMDGRGSGSAGEGREDWGGILALVGDAFAQPDSPFETAPDPGRCIFVRDYGGSPRGNVMAFVFGPRDSRPTAVAKTRAAAIGGAPLRGEWEALLHLHDALPADLSGRIPHPVAFRRLGALHVLVVSPLPGRSGYVELYQGLHPERLPRSHFAAALAWLVAFQEATRRPGHSYAPQDEPVGRRWSDGDDPTPPWFDSLRDDCDRAGLPLSAVHGDFWIRNLLMRRHADSMRSWRDGACVVDWEHFEPAGSPFTDLFHFAITYVLNFPWSRYRRRAPLEAFRLGFLKENAVSREVREFLMGYCSRTGTDPRLLAPLAHMHLLERARQDRDGADVWLGCHQLLERAERSVLTPP